MRILALNDEPEAGGAAQLFRRTNRLLRQRGHDVIEVTGSVIEERLAALNGHASSRSGRYLGSIRQELSSSLRQVYFPFLLAELTRILDQTPVDVAHVHNLHGRLSTQVLPFLKSRGIPTVCQVNDYFFFCNSYVAYNRKLDAPCKRCIGGNILWAVRYSCVGNLGEGRLPKALIHASKRLALRWTNPWRGITLFLVTSDQAASLLEEWGVERTRQRKLFNPMVNREFDVPTSLGDEIVFYGTCLPSKGTETFLAALEHVQPGCRLGVYLTGMTGDYEGRLRAVAARRGLQLCMDARLRWQTGLRERVAASRAVVVPSQWWVTSESVVYEGMLLGKAVIVSRIGGNAELVEHGTTGLLVEPRNARELAHAINLLASNRTLAGRLGEAARERARERFAESAFLNPLESAYRDAIAMETARS